MITSSQFFCRRAFNLSSRGQMISDIRSTAACVVSFNHHRLFFRATATSVIAPIIRQIGQERTQIAVEIVGIASASQDKTATNHATAVIVNIIFAVNFGCSLIRSATF